MTTDSYRSSYNPPPNKDRPRLTVKVFYCYAHDDKLLRDELDKHLSTLKRSGRITTWYDREIVPGTRWEDEINERLDSANLILLLISASFLASDYCWGKEMQQALECHKAGTAHIIPIILRPVRWKDTPIGELQLLPTDGKPVTQWPDRDSAFEDIANGVSLVVDKLLIQLEEEARRQQRIRELEGQMQGLVDEANARRSRIESLNTEFRKRTDAKTALQLKLAEIQSQIASLEADTRQLQADLDSTYRTESEAQQRYNGLIDQLRALKPFIWVGYPAIQCPNCGTSVSLGSSSCSKCGWRYPGRLYTSLADSFVL